MVVSGPSSAGAPARAGTAARPRRGTALAALVVLAAGAALFAAPLTGDVLFYRDLGLWLHPVLESARTSADAGTALLPQWTSALSAGRPLLANPAYALLHPASLLAVVLPFDSAFTLFVVLQALAGGVSMVVLARVAGLGPRAAALAGVAWLLGGWSVSATSLYALVGPGAWAPLTLAAGIAAVRTPSLPRRLATAALLALQWLGGSPEPTVLTVVVGATWCAVAFAPGSAGHRLARTARVWAEATVTSLLLAAPQLLPALLHSRETLRSFGFTVRGALYWSLHPSRVAEMVVPGAGGDPLARLSGGYAAGARVDGDLPLLVSIYAGLSVVALALVAAVVSGGRARWVGVVAATALAGVVLALGRFLPGVETLLGALPVPLWLRFPEKALLASFLSLPLLAGAGAEWVARHTRAPGAVGTLLVAVVLLDLGLAHRGLVPTVAPELLDGGQPLARRLRDRAQELGADEAQWRLYHHRLPGPGWGPRVRPEERLTELDDYLRRRALLMPMTGLHAGLAHVFEPSIEVAQDRELFALSVALHRADAATWARGLGTAAALWVVSPLPDLEERTGGLLVRELRPGWRLGVPPGSATVYRNRAYLPRVRVAAAVLGVPEPSTELVLAALDGAQWPPPTVVDWTEELPATAGGTATIASDTGERLTVVVDAETDALLVVADVHAPGWSATVDGDPVDIGRAELAFRTVAVPAGTHTVVFTYATPGLRAGCALALAGLLLPAAATAAIARRGRAGAAQLS